MRSTLPANWAQQVLQDLGISPDYDQSVQALHDIAESEVSDMVFNGSLNQGGAYNPFDSEGRLDSSTNYNSVGVQDYSSWTVGRQATVNLLKQPNFAGVLQGLRQNNGQGAIDAYNTLVAQWGAPGASYGAASPPGGYSSGGTGAPHATLDSDLGPISNAAQKVAGILGDLYGGIFGSDGSGLDGSFKNFFKILAWIVRPMEWLRIFCGIGGFIFAGGGIYALIGVI